MGTIVFHISSSYHTQSDKEIIIPTMANYNPSIETLELIRNAEQTKEDDGTVFLDITLPIKAHRCPKCGEYTDRIKGYHKQVIPLRPWLGVNLTYIRLRKRRYICPHCHRSFFEDIHWLLRYQRRPQCVVQEMVREAAYSVPFSWIARKYGVSVTTVIRYFDYIQMAKPIHLPTVLSIDDFKGNDSGHKFQVSLVDAVQHKIVDILPNRDTQEIIDYFNTSSKEERSRIKYVVMDLSPLFRKAIRTVFPKAVIVGDRFHIQRLVTWAMEAVRKRIQKELGKKRIYLKRSRKVLCKPGWKVTQAKLPYLEYALRQSDELRRAYALKETFYKVWRMTSEENADMLHQCWIW